MDSTQKYIVWAIVAALVIGGGFFVYKKMHATTIQHIAPISETGQPFVGPVTETTSGPLIGEQDPSVNQAN